MSASDPTLPHLKNQPGKSKTGFRRFKPWIIGAIALAAAAGAIWFIVHRGTAPPEGFGGPGGFGGGRGGGGGFRGGPGGPGGQATPVTIGVAKLTDLKITLSALGTIVPRNSVTVRPRVSGMLTAVRFTEGQIVKAGEVLAEIDPQTFQTQLDQVSGQMARDTALLKNAQLDLERYKKLLAQDSIAKQEVDTQETLVRQYQGTLQANQGQVDNARLQLSYTKVTAPISGRAGLRAVDPGNMMTSSDANGLVVITQISPITAVFSVPEDNVPTIMRRLKSGATMTVEAWDREQKNKLAEGVLLATDSQIDATTGTIKLKAPFGNENGELFPNQFVNIRLLVDVRENTLVIPNNAVQRGAQGTFVYAVNEDKTVSVKVIKLGPVDGDVVAVESGGLQPGTQVVTDGMDRLREGAKVEPTIPPEAIVGNPNRRGNRGPGGPNGKGPGQWKGGPGKGGPGVMQPGQWSGAGKGTAGQNTGGGAGQSAGFGSGKAPLDAGTAAGNAVAPGTPAEVTRPAGGEQGNAPANAQGRPRGEWSKGEFKGGNLNWQGRRPPEGAANGVQKSN